MEKTDNETILGFKKNYGKPGINLERKIKFDGRRRFLPALK